MADLARSCNKQQRRRVVEWHIIHAEVCDPASEYLSPRHVRRRCEDRVEIVRPIPRGATGGVFIAEDKHKPERYRVTVARPHVETASECLFITIVLIVPIAIHLRLALDADTDRALCGPAQDIPALGRSEVASHDCLPINGRRRDVGASNPSAANSEAMRLRNALSGCGLGPAPAGLPEHARCVD